MAKIIWSNRALADIERITAYIQDFNPLAAQRLALRLWSAAESLGDMPERGRSLRGGRREFVVVHPYLIGYTVTQEVVEIITVRHGAREPEA